MAESDDGFVRRWSQRKRKTRQDQRDADDPSAPGLPAESAQEAAVPAEAPDNLPDVDSLDESSDFTVFLKEGVPDIIRRKALRKLWRVHPAMAVIDGLDDYDDDYTVSEALVKGLKTVYEAGKGYLDEDEAGEVPTAAEDEEVAESATESETVPGEASKGAEAEPETAPSVPAGKEKTTLVADAKPAIPARRQAAHDGESGASTHAAQTHKRSARQRRWGQVVDE